MSLYLEHFGLREPAFRITPHPEFFYAGARRGATLEALVYALNNEEGILLVSGEVGTGKTMLLRMLMEKLPSSHLPIWISNPSLGPDELLRSIAFQLGLGETPRPLLDSIQERLIALYADGRRAVALIDEAHAMPTASLEQVRLLSNLETAQHKLLQIVLFGQPELDSLIRGSALRALRERITQRFRLNTLSKAETARYLEHRLATAGYRGRDPFSRPALWALARSAGGLTRRANILADKALLAAFADGTRSVGLRHVWQAARDAGYPAPFRAPLLTLVAVLLLAAVAIPFGFYRDRSLPPPTAALVAHEKPAAGIPAPKPALIETPPPDPVAALIGQPVATRLKQTRQWLDGADGKRWCIQILGVAPNQAARLEQLMIKLDAEALGMPIRVYAGPGSPVGRLGLIAGEFPDRISARNAVARLPAWARNGQPYVRSLASLKPSAVKDKRVGGANSVKIGADTFTDEEAARIP